MKTRIAIIALVALAAGGTATGIFLSTRTDKGGKGDGGGVVLTQTELRYRLLARFGPLHYCDPDFYPIGVEGGEERSAKQWWSTTDHKGEEITVIRTHLSLGAGELDPAAILRAFRDHKRLQAIPLEAAGAGFRFDVRTEADKGEEIETAGVIASTGRITIEKQQRVPSFGCPICLGGNTSISTPGGAVRVAELRAGMFVWSVDASGHRIAATIVQTTRRAVATPHPMIRLTLDDGRSIAASPGHPTADGRSFGSLLAGDLVDGAHIVSVGIELVSEPFTYDILPSGPTGAYWADGVLIGSTLAVDSAA